MIKSTVLMIALAAVSNIALAKVQGLYGTDCLKIEGLSAYKDLAFDGDELKQVQTVYLDSECQITAYDFTFTGPYHLDEQLEFLDYSFSSVHLTALDEQVAENFNQHQLCGISNWQVGVAEDVAGLNCGDKQIPALQLRVFDRLRAEGDTIRMSRPSSEFNGSSEELRPRELDTSVFHAK